MNKRKLSILKEVLIFSLFVTLLFLSFRYNFFGAAGKWRFNFNFKWSEAYVVGKVLNSQLNPILDEQALLRINGHADITYKNYFHNETHNISSRKYSNYKSSFGIQGYIYAIIDFTLKRFEKDPKSRYQIMRAITGMGMSIVIAIFIFFIKFEFGLPTALFVLITTIYSNYLVLFASNLYWMFFIALAPFTLSWTYLKIYEDKNVTLSPLYFAICFLILLKSLAGWEYLSTIFISFNIPLVYFSIKNNWNKKLIIERIIKINSYALLGFILSLFGYLAQKTALLGSVNNALKAFAQIVLKRTHGNPADLPSKYKASLESDILAVLKKYLNGDAIYISDYMTIKFHHIILLFSIVSIFYVSIPLFKNLEKDKKTTALIISSWLSILAPISWHVLAKGHSYVHGHMNHVLWHVPFTFLAFSSVAYIIRKYCFHNPQKGYKNNIFKS